MKWKGNGLALKPLWYISRLRLESGLTRFSISELNALCQMHFLYPLPQSIIKGKHVFGLFAAQAFALGKSPKAISSLGNNKERTKQKGQPFQKVYQVPQVPFLISSVSTFIKNQVQVLLHCRDALRIENMKKLSSLYPTVSFSIQRTSKVHWNCYLEAFGLTRNNKVYCLVRKYRRLKMLPIC